MPTLHKNLFLPKFFIHIVNAQNKLIIFSLNKLIFFNLCFFDRIGELCTRIRIITVIEVIVSVS